MENVQPRRLWWIALTLPLPVAVLAVYAAFEWLFFVTKPSVLTALDWPDRLTALVETPVPFIPIVLTIQAIVTLLGVIAFKHLRAVALLPSGLLLGALGLVLIDNFTHVLFGFSSTNIDVRLRYVYAVVLLLLITTATHWLYGFLSSGSAPRKALLVLLLALPSLAIFAYTEAQRPRVGGFFSFGESRKAPSAQRPNVLFLTNDSLESRYMSVYGYAKRTTPFLETLRDETLFCENAFPNACRTYGSLVVLLTGKRPTRTHVLDPPSMVYDAARHEHLPGILRQHGYRTLQLTMKHYADAADANLVGAFDLANYDWEMLRLGRVDNATDTARVFRLQVFDRLQERLTRIFAGKDRASFAFVIGKSDPPYWSDDRRVKTLIDFMTSSAEPWFAHVHLLDTHEGITGDDTDPDAALRDADDHMRRVFEALRSSGKLDRTIVVISSDHGRDWQTRDRVPLMIRFPRGQHARRIATNVQTADIAPTTLDALGLPIPSWMDGRSLLRPLPAERDIVALCGVAAQVTGRPEDAAKLRVPNFGTATAMIVEGSWWYEMQIASGVMRGGPVDGHTVPKPQTPPDVARAALERELSAVGFRLASARSTESAIPTPAPASVRP